MEFKRDGTVPVKWQSLIARLVNEGSSSKEGASPSNKLLDRSLMLSRVNNNSRELEDIGPSAVSLLPPRISVVRDSSPSNGGTDPSKLLKDKSLALKFNLTLTRGSSFPSR